MTTLTFFLENELLQQLGLTQSRAPQLDQPVSSQQLDQPASDQPAIVFGQQDAAVFSPSAAVQYSSVFPPLLSVFWFLGVLAMSFRLIRDYRRLKWLRRSAVVLENTMWRQSLLQLCERLKVRRTVQLLGSLRIDSPLLMGTFRPVILVPLSMISCFSPEQVEAILAHELGHLQRNDYLANLLQVLIETLLFYHPLVWRVSLQVRADREFICDDFAVTQAGTDSILYAKTLAQLEQIRQERGIEMQRILSNPASDIRWQVSNSSRERSAAE